MGTVTFFSRVQSLLSRPCAGRHSTVTGDRTIAPYSDPHRLRCALWTDRRTLIPPAPMCAKPNAQLVKCPRDSCAVPVANLDTMRTPLPARIYGHRMTTKGTRIVGGIDHCCQAQRDGGWVAGYARPHVDGSARIDANTAVPYDSTAFWRQRSSAPLSRTPSASRRISLDMSTDYDLQQSGVRCNVR